MTLGLPEGQAGVLPIQHLRIAMAAGWISAGRFATAPENLQPASLDLRLGETAYRIRSSFLPGQDSVENKLKTISHNKINLREEGARFEPGCAYLVELKEHLALPRGIRARANPKSSTGRADVFTRVITDRSYLFDEIAEAYNGPLYLEVVPLSFPIWSERT